MLLLNFLMQTISIPELKSVRIFFYSSAFLGLPVVTRFVERKLKHTNFGDDQ
jgi:hypothetical protein